MKTNPSLSLQTSGARASRIAELEQRLLPLLGEEAWIPMRGLLDEVLRLKAETGALILAHNYQRPEIFHGVADLTGDSLALAQLAAQSESSLMVLCGVHFMAETAKLLNPKARVLIPDLQAGCSLAESITPEDVRALREQYPGVPVVTYVNTSAAVKAECDCCCTSGNAVKIVEALGSERVLFLPDEYLGQYVASQTGVELILWRGHCEVHERFTAAKLVEQRERYPRAQLLAHPECSPEVLAAADMVGSTAQMADYVRLQRPAEVVMVTEQEMGRNLSVLYPQTQFHDLAYTCPHMQLITLEKLLISLRDGLYEVSIDEDIASRARRSVERMLELGRGGKA